ncbi:hypothetical protein [Alicyclobacillus sp.]|uniref:hypothetical protein n=1 Tax=Alicyclobacillus sp. TaxID=61169 RepID=UPI0025C07010|nr:hypothetical protein [Alicyclobacillus sp.]MCL6517870.1 hypothetical protein [Alicyclobacillus sp.]
MRRRWTVVFAAMGGLLGMVAGWWGDGIARHWTPEKALASAVPGVMPFEKVSYSDGVVLFTPGPGGPGTFGGFYMEPGWFGWRIGVASEVAFAPGNPNANGDLASFRHDGQTFIWGTAFVPAREIVFQHDGRTYRAPIGTFSVWHMIVPFEISTFLHSEWSLVTPDGRTIPFFPEK